MAKSIKKNFIYNLIYQILILSLPLATAPYVARVLGAENLGIYGYTLSIATYFILFGTLGTTKYGQREIAYFADNKSKRSRAFWEIFFLKSITMLISILTYSLIFIAAGVEYRSYYAILSLNIIANIFDISWFFHGLEEFRKMATVGSIARILGFIATFIFVKTPADLPFYFFITCFSALVGNLSSWFFLPRYINRPDFKKLRILKHLKKTILLFIPEIAISVYAVLDKTMIGAMVADKSEVGFYEQSEKIVKLLLSIVTSLGVVMASRVAQDFAKKKFAKIAENIEKSFRLVYFLAFPIIFGILAVADIFCPLFFGPGYEKVPLLIRILTPIVLMIGIGNIIGIQYLLPTGKERKYTRSVIIGAIVNLVTNLCLIPNFGAVGAAISTVIAETIIAAIQLFFVRKDFEVKNLIKPASKYLLVSIVMFLVCFAVSKVVPNNLLGLIIIVIVGTLFYILSLALTRDEMLKSITSSIKTKLIGHKE